MYNIDQNIKELDDYIKKLSKYYNIKKNNFNSSSSNKSYLCNERTLSSYCNYFLNIILNKSNKVVLCVNEFPIEIDDSVPKDVIKKSIKGITIPEKYKWNRCYIDGYFQVENNGNIDHLFLEYKLNKKIKYLDLGIDFIKYKIYTYNSYINSFFIYVVMDKDEQYPTIIKKNSKLYQFLQPNLVNFNNDTRVYIYNSKNRKYWPKNIKSGNIMVLFSKLEEINNKYNKLKDEIEVEFKTDDEKLKNSMKKFNSKVLTAFILKNNYYYINSIWKIAENCALFSGIKEKITNEKYNYIESKGEQFKNINLELTTETKSTAENNGIRGADYTSLKILGLIELFAEKNNLNVSVKPNYGTKKLKAQKREAKINYLKVAKEQSNKFLGETTLEKMNEIVYVILYLINNIYPLLYIIENNKICGEQKAYQLYKIEEEMNKILGKINKYLGYKNTIDCSNLDNSEIMGEYLNYIIGLFESK